MDRPRPAPEEGTPSPEAGFTDRIEETPAETLFEAGGPGDLEHLADTRLGVVDDGGSFGRFVDAREIGRGGMGVVFEATDPSLKRRVAVKILLRQAPPDSAAGRKFLFEAQLAGRLEHPNIVPVHEMGTAEDGRPYFAMKRVQGQTLAGLIDTLAALPDEERREWTRTRLLSLFLKVTDAVAFAHSQGVIHRDLKPSNVMVGEFGEVLLTDWGLARVLDEPDWAADPEHVAALSAEDETLVQVTETADGTVVGTPAYMSPEQAQGDIAAIDERSDLYSLGAILYEILTLTPPFGGDSAWQTIARVGRGDVEPPSARAPAENVPRELEAVVLKAMARRPSDRYQHVLELRADLEAYLEGRTLAAARYSPAQRVVKWLARHRAATLASGAVVVLAGLLYGLFAWREGRAVEERGRQLVAEAEALGTEVRAAEAELDRLVPADPRATLFEANGERREEAIRWVYAAYATVLDLLDQQAELADQAPTEAARQRIDRPAIDRQRRLLCLRAADLAGQLGDVTIARLWVDRAARAGLSPEERRAAVALVEEADRLRLEADLGDARGTLERLESWEDGQTSFDLAVTMLLRHRGPDLVRELLDGGHLDHPSDLVRRVAIETLGRIGDTRTTGADGRDAVEVLGAWLTEIDLDNELETAVAIARALGFLGDPRAHPMLVAARRRSGNRSRFWQRTDVVLRRLPPPIVETPTTADGWNQVGLSHLQGQRPDEALDAFERALALRPDDARLLVNRGNAHLVRGDADSAEADYDRAIELEPDLALAWANRGSLRLQAGQLEPALSDLDRTLALSPEQTDARLNRARVLVGLGRLDEARAELDRALEIEPRLDIALAQRGMLRHEAGDQEGALADLDRAIDINPANRNAVGNRGLVLSALGRHEEAIEAFTGAIEMEPHPGLYLNRGRSRATRGDLAGAIRDFDQALRLAPDMAEAFANRAIARSERGDVAEARADWAAAAAAAPTSVVIRLGRGRFLAGLGDYDAAEDELTRVLLIEPDHLDALHARADVRSERGDADGARADYDRMVAAHPTHVPAWIDRGVLRFRAGDAAGAEADFDEAIELDPERREAWVNRGVVRKANADLTGALADFDRALEIEPDDWRLRFGVGVLRVEHGQRDRGLAEMRRAIESAPPAERPGLEAALAEVERGG